MGAEKRTRGGDGLYTPQHGYEARHRGRGGESGRQSAQEERYVEGDLFGATQYSGGPQRRGFNLADPPAGKPPRTPYYGGDTGGYRSSVGGVGDYEPQAVTRSSPFARHSLNTDTPNFATPSSMMHTSARRDRTPMEHVSNGGQDSRPWPFASNENGVSLEHLNAGGSGRGFAGADARDAMDEDDDDLPTRSLVDDGRVAGAGFPGGEGLRNRRPRGDPAADRGVDFSSGASRPDIERDTWVVVWGVPPGKSTDALSCFLEFGHIQEQRGHDDSNWLFLRYATRLQAEKAVAAGHGSRLSDKVMLGVQKVQDEAWLELKEDRVPPLSSAQGILLRGSGARSSGGNFRTPSGDGPNPMSGSVDDSSVVNVSRPRSQSGGNVCRKIMAFFGFY